MRRTIINLKTVVLNSCHLEPSANTMKSSESGDGCQKENVGCQALYLCLAEHLCDGSAVEVLTGYEDKL